MTTDDQFVWICQYCGTENEVWVDLTIPDKQDFVEDCRICCRPNRILVTRDRKNEEYFYVESRITDE
jgi:Cysteine-rich CPXCG